MEKFVLLVLLPILLYCMFVGKTYESASEEQNTCELSGGTWHQDSKPMMPVSGKCL